MSSIAPPKSARAHAAYTHATVSRSQDRARYALAALFGIYLAVLSWTVLWELETPWIGHASERVLKLIPYVATGSAGANIASEVALNILLFIPFGVYLRYLAPRWSNISLLGLIAGTSIAFEAIQYWSAIGVTDTTDVINNTLGGLIGMVMFALLQRTFRRRTDAILLRVMLIGTLGALVLVTVYVLGSPAQQVGPPMQLPPQL